MFASSSRSKIVGTYSTGDVRYGPAPDMLGTQAGTRSTGLPGPALHRASRWLSHPQPGPMVFGVVVVSGLSPMNPSRSAEAITMCPTHDGVERNSNVRSETLKAVARAVMFGICAGSYCSKHAYGTGALGPHPRMLAKPSIL